MKLGTEIHRRALAACDAWSAELRKAFGKKAGDMRYRPEGKGQPGTALHAAHQEFAAATAAWEADK